MALLKSSTIKKALRKAMKPQQILAAIEDSVKPAADEESSARTAASSLSNNDSLSSLTEDDMAKIGPQELLRMLEGQTDSESYQQLATAMQELGEDEDDGDFEICLDDFIPQIVSIA